MMRENEYELTLEGLFEQNKLLLSALLEIHGDNVKSTSLFCLEQGINLGDRDKILLTLNKFSDRHTKDNLVFWKEKLSETVPYLINFSDTIFQKMIDLFWKDYIDHK